MWVSKSLWSTLQEDAPWCQSMTLEGGPLYQPGHPSSSRWAWRQVTLSSASVENCPWSSFLRLLGLTFQKTAD